MQPGSLDKAGEAALVGFARKGNADAFGELVRRRQSWVRNLMRRLCGDPVLADDLSQQAFVQAWRAIPALQDTERFGGWMKRLAVNTWLQHHRKQDALTGSAELQADIAALADDVAKRIDLDQALSALPEVVRLCIVLSYHERMTHPEIAEMTRLPPGTVKSHIRRGTAQLRELLGAYRPNTKGVRKPWTKNETPTF